MKTITITIPMRRIYSYFPPNRYKSDEVLYSLVSQEAAKILEFDLEVKKKLPTQSDLTSTSPSQAELRAYSISFERSYSIFYLELEAQGCDMTCNMFRNL